MSADCKNISVNIARLLSRLQELGQIGRDDSGRLSRLAASDADRLGRDRFASWAREIGLDVRIDPIGNIFAVWQEPENRTAAPILVGSHIDTVIDAGIYDGCYGVVAGLEVIETLREAGVSPGSPVVVAAFTNEEGLRYQPTMIGSLAFAGGVAMQDALAIEGVDGTTLGAELARIGYIGSDHPPIPRPRAYLELHVEQGPVLDREGIPIGAVDGVQGILQQQIAIDGVANHAGTTPMGLRHDAGHAAARIAAAVLDRAKAGEAGVVATVGRLRLEPDAINVIPSRATLTVDIRHRDQARLDEEEAALSALLADMENEFGVGISVTTLARSEPVHFDDNLIGLVEEIAASRGLASRRLTSGAGHDAKMLAKIVPSTMIFVPSVGGISHNPKEKTEDLHIEQGANVLLDAVCRLINQVPV